MKHVTILSGSPRPSEATVSQWLAERAAACFGTAETDVQLISALQCQNRKETEAAFDRMSESDALLIVLPLYFFCVPGMLMRLLQDYAEYLGSHGGAKKSPLVYAAVNCGFPEGEICQEAVRVIASFAGAVGGHFRFGVMLGSGGMLLGAQQAPFMKSMLAGLDDAFARMRSEITGETGLPGGETAPVVLNAKFPRRLYFLAGNMGWRSMAKGNKLGRKDLLAKPYALTAPKR